jgi:hypothetical protein
MRSGPIDNADLVECGLVDCGFTEPEAVAERRQPTTRNMEAGT